MKDADDGIGESPFNIWIPKALCIISTKPYYDFFQLILLDLYYTLFQNAAQKFLKPIEGSTPSTITTMGHRETKLPLPSNLTSIISAGSSSILALGNRKMRSEDINFNVSRFENDKMFDLGNETQEYQQHWMLE